MSESEIVKVCKHHGELTRDMIYEESMNKGLTFRLRCIQCIKMYELKNREKRLAYSREYEKTRRKRPDDYYQKHVKPASRKWRQENADKVNEKVRADRAANPQKYRQYDADWRAANKLHAQELDIVQKHKISLDDYKLMFASQGGLCYICNQPEKRKSRTTGQICRLAIDHNHTTGAIRKLLCHNCNQVVGHCRESIENLQKTIDYLKEHAQ